MEAPNRGRSPSAGQQANQRIRSSPSPHDFNGHVSPLNFNNQPPNQTFTSQPFNDNNLSPTSGGNINFNNSSSYLDAGNQQPQFLQPQSLTSGSDFNNQGFDELFQTGGLTANEQGQPNFDPRESDPQFQSEMLALNTNFGGFPHQQGFNVKQEHYNKNDLFLDPQLQNAQQNQDQSINPADIMSNVSSPQNLVPTPPHLLQVNSQHSEPTSPFGQPSHDWSPGHSRHASLDPSAAYGNGQQQEWGGMMQGPQFQQHRRAPSEHSDVSSSVAPSPYMPQSDTFEFDQNASPMLGPQRDNHLYQDGLGIGSFSISDDKSQNHSPRHSPFVSPRMSPQPGLGAAKEMSFMGLPETQRGFGGRLTPEGYPTSSEQFPVLPPEQRLPSNDYGQADQYDVPQINVDPAPMAHPPLMEQHPRSPTDMDALSPPEQRGRKGNRMRAKSDTYISRPVTPSSTAPTIGSTDSSIARNHSLSPHDMAAFSPNNSRSPSPAPRSPSARRSSTSSIPNRDYILELADPNRPPAPGTEKRVQKHPATFSCHLCPKKFTRAYNLRSHLRTHTDERPFVCTVCSKAFARQHDRKRHEGLHSGEKKFVCRGELGTGAAWGCGRRFARADALGRHFRSEAGRVCIKPLLDEEAMERQRLDEHMMAQNMGGMAPQAPMNGMGMQQPFAFPAALLQQFPQLQNMQWDQMQGPDEEDYSGHSSFDASSGGDFYDDEDGGSGYVSDNPMGVGYGGSSAWQNNQGWKSDVEP